MSFNKPKLPKGLKQRAHHNKTGQRLIKSDRMYEDARRMADSLGIPYVTKRKADRILEKEEATRRRRAERADLALRRKWLGWV